jgi:hypothetical protein
VLEAEDEDMSRKMRCCCFRGSKKYRESREEKTEDRGWVMGGEDQKSIKTKIRDERWPTSRWRPTTFTIDLQFE